MPWLMKAEPDSRIVKGKDVKFSVDDFEDIGNHTNILLSEGVRNHEAKKIMKEKMKLGDKVLFYHSNTKLPGIFALAEIAKEGYPDHTAWDPSHPYFDPKSDETNPTWYMVDVKFTQRLEHPPTLPLIKYLASLSDLPEQVGYVGTEGLKAIKEMALVNRGRLSVQPVTDEAYGAIVLLGTKGGWDELVPQGKGKAKSAGSSKIGSRVKEEKSAAGVKRNGSKRKVKPKAKEEDAESSDLPEADKVKPKATPAVATGERLSKRVKR